MAVVGARGQQRSERDLVHHRASGVGQALRQPGRADELWGHHHPPDAQSGRQCLARRADIDHPIRCDALQGTDRCPVIAVFGVVVVLDDQVTGARPLHERGAPGGGEHHAGRRLVCGGGQHRRRAAVRQRGDVDAVVVDRNGQWLDTVVPQHHSMQPESGVLHGQRQLTALEHAPEQRDRLRRSRTEHDVLRVGLYAAGASQVVRDGGARGGQSLRVDVSERVRADVGQSLAQRPQPCGAGEAAEIR